MNVRDLIHALSEEYVDPMSEVLVIQYSPDLPTTLPVEKVTTQAGADGKSVFLIDIELPADWHGS